MQLGAKGGRHDPARGMVPIGMQVFRLVQHQMLDITQEISGSTSSKLQIMRSRSMACTLFSTCIHFLVV